MQKTTISIMRCQGVHRPVTVSRRVQRRPHYQGVHGQLELPNLAFGNTQKGSCHKTIHRVLPYQQQSGAEGDGKEMLRPSSKVLPNFGLKHQYLSTCIVFTTERFLNYYFYDSSVTMLCGLRLGNFFPPISRWWRADSV
jgi:hypothetical protein